MDSDNCPEPKILDMLVEELSSKELQTVAWAMGFYKWRSRTHLQAMINAWPHVTPLRVVWFWILQIMISATR